MPASNANNPALVAKALAKAQSVESRLNAMVGGQFGTPTQPTVVYTSTQTIVTQSGNGNYSWTCPAGVSQATVECWGAGAGGGGGGPSEGGEGGGGGAYSQEPLMTVTPGGVYNYTVGTGGSGGPSGNVGNTGGDSYFNNDGNAPGISVYAHGGNAGGGFVGGTGGTGTGNTISVIGGNGGGDGSQSTGGCGGGGSAGSTGNGGNASDSGSSTGSSGGSAGTGGGAVGGAGGNSNSNGNNGSGPGGGGGGAGAAVGGSTLTKTYNASGDRSYYGSDASPSIANTWRTQNSTLYHGGTTSGGGSYNGTQKSIITFPTNPNIINDFSGATAVSATFGLTNDHCFYSSGMSIQVRSWNVGGGAPSSWNGSTNSTLLYNSFINQGVTKQFNLSQSVAANFINGTYFGIAIGPGPNNLDNNWYGYFQGASQSNNPTLTITATTGATVAAGNGADGQVRITYNTPTTFVASLQPASTSDTSGNSMAPGYTGAVVAVQPGSSPANLESWHTLTTPTGMTGTIRCKILAETNLVVVDVNLNITSTVNTGGTTYTSGSMPSSAYYTTAQRDFPLSVNQGMTNPSTPRLRIPASSGSVLLLMPQFITSGLSCIVSGHAVFPAD